MCLTQNIKYQQYMNNNYVLVAGRSTPELAQHIAKCLNKPLLSVDILQFKDGEILASKFAVTRRDRTIHKRMREYLAAISEDERLCTVLLETGDGAALSVRRRGACGQKTE